MEPFYFGAPDRGQFGMYHPPAGLPKDEGAVLCPPFFGEYLRAHSCLRRVALALASTGTPVLRFDYRGTGDSAGNFEETTPDGWRADVGTAITELQDISGVGRVRLVGVRLGATLAAQVASDHQAVKGLVLWDPIADGEAYVKQLEQTHRRLLASHKRRSAARAAGNGMELVGFRVTEAMLRQLRTVVLPGWPDLLSSQDRSIRLVLSAGTHGHGDVASNAQASGVSVRHVHLNCNWATHSEAVLPAHEVLGALSSEA